MFELTALIGKRHGGSVTDLVLYKDEVNARNLLSEPMKTLDAIFHVPSDAASAAAAVIFYDFAAFESDCPLLLRPPDLHGTEKAKGGEGEGRRRRQGEGEQAEAGVAAARPGRHAAVGAEPDGEVKCAVVR